MIKPDTILTVEGTDKEALFTRLASAATELLPDMDQQTLLDGIWTREKLLSTRLSDHVAMPHAQFESLKATRLIVALCPGGIVYDAHEKSPVYIAFCVIGDRATHLATLSRIAAAIQPQEMLDQLVTAARADSASAVADLLDKERFSPPSHAVSAAPDRQLGRSQRLWLHALELARAVDARCILLHATSVQAKSFQVPEDMNGEIFVVSPEDLGVPKHSIASSSSGGISISLLYALTEGRIRQEDVVVAFYGSHDPEMLDTVQVTDVNSAFRLFFSVSKELELDSEVQRVMLRVIELASEIAHEGREGKPTGALFVIGDLPAVVPHCQQMLMNPFKGYDEQDRNVLDPGLTETVKELSRIDGAFIISAGGAIETAGTYLRVDVDVPDLPSGLGARHAAAAAITAVSQSIAIAVSESTRQVSIFRHGRRVIIL